ncbi:Phage protein [Escherichia coli]|uniref:Uncharacterized protein n=2 Tax=Phapecoctavirus TaxID=2733124 RepID=A0A499PTU6_9CAUD|nr:hypothetical protein HOR21_gp043 [Escherichia phage ESCO13]YP_009985000.1 hypothetical protein JR319_gp182 [Escherichia phage vB_EcoM-Ro121c4YLVW]AOQ27198.1 hypothetical protein ESCO13_00059 [Escherichia phage ESCO13]AVZ45431.1 hypothetical protein [Escherichia phage vB_EcoM-Ro121c4YLVW]ELO6086299.1 hypothetical protein [Escherichia coli]
MLGKIKAFFKRVIEGSPTEGALGRSLTGEPLAIISISRHGGYSIRQTPLGIKGSMLSWTISQVGDNRLAAIALLRGEYDYCLSASCKKHLIEHIRDRVEREGGYFFETKRNEQGTLDFTKVYWDNHTRQTVEQLLEERC